MPVDIDKLLKFRIPEVRQTLVPKDIALYALSVGMGRAPCDVDQLRYVDPLQGPVVMPAMVLVMAHPGFWLGDPESGVDPAAVLHAAQSFEILGPLPQRGDVLSRTRVTNVVDKGAGKAALIFSETELFDGANALLARLERTTFIRDGGGFGGHSGQKSTEMPTPEAPADLTVDLGTGREQALLYRLNGDLNPLHSDPAVAVKAGFAVPILHGLCTMGVVTHALLRGLAHYRAEILRSVRLRFSTPVLPGETIRTEIWMDGRFRALALERGVVVAEGGAASTESVPQ